MKTKNQILLLEEGEILDELSLDFIIGGVNDQYPSDQSCDHCDTCGNGGNNSNNGDGGPLISMG